MTNQNERNGIEIAVVGMAGRFPGAANLDEYWLNLREGRASIRFYEPHELRELNVDESVISDPRYVPAWAELEGRDDFDAHFFRFSPAEAERLSPQHRVFLEIAWHALEDAGIDPLRTQERIGLYCGAGMNTYMLHNELHREMTGPNPFPAYFANGHDFLASRTAYKLNLRGPAVTVQTACSTSLTAIHLACQSILGGECDTALAGGVAVIPHPRPGYYYLEGGTLSPDGHCRAFDENAQGTIPGSGGGVVVLKSLEDALACGDFIHAVIRGSAINNDGGDKIGYTAPSAKGQENVIREAQGIAEVDPRTIAYIETHGTGTVLGDPIEVAALRNVFPSDAHAYCALGSVKTNIGHLDAAAGIAGFLKTVLSLKNGVLPPSLNCETPNPELKLEDGPFFINTSSRPWPESLTPRRAGVSSFGIGGSNAHLVLEQAPPPIATDHPNQSEDPQVIFLSARDEGALESMTENLADYLERNPQVSIREVSQSLSEKRGLFEHRRSFPCESVSQAVELLRERPADRVFTGFVAARDTPIVFLFPGQGVQYAGMGNALYKKSADFRVALDECAQIAEPMVGMDLRELLFATSDSATSRRLRRTEFLQPALFAFETALARYWLKRGPLPRAMLGHSLGEFTAACIAGVFSLTDALTAVTARGKLMGELPAGSMLSIAASATELADKLSGDVSIAAVNEAKRTTVSGPSEAISQLAEALRAEGRDFRELQTSHAFHSPMMEPALAPFRKVLSKLKLNEPEIPFISSVTGNWIEPSVARDPDYWTEQLRAPVQFARGLETLGKIGEAALLECGPGTALGATARRTGLFSTITGSMPGPHDQMDETQAPVIAEARLRIAGVTFKSAANVGRSSLRLPRYPFQSKYFRLPDTDSKWEPHEGNLFHLPTWIREPIPTQASAHDNVLILSDDTHVDLAAQLAHEINARDAAGNATLAYPGPQFQEEPDGFRIPFQADGLKHLFAHLERIHRLPSRVILLVGEVKERTTPAETLDPAMERYLAFPLDLIRALAALSNVADVRLLLVSNGLFDVVGNEEPNAWAALLQGPVLTAPSEYEGLQCRVVDIETSKQGTLSGTVTANLLLRELYVKDKRNIIALRGRHRWVREIRSMATPVSRTPDIRPDGTYVITGGTGGIGLQIARELAQHSAGGIALVSRGNVDAREIHGELQAIRNSGTGLLMVQADVCDRDALETALQKIETELGPVRGIIHCAGIPAGGVIELKTREAMRKVLAPRVLGTLHLDQWAQGRDLDFMVLCSSVSSISGGTGQADYAAANAFLDSHANFIARTSTAKIRSINWDAWREVGMAARGVAAPTVGAPSEQLEFINDETFPGRLVLRRENHLEYAGLLRVQDTWLLSEHRLKGTALLPGTAYLQAIHSALREFSANESFLLEEVDFLEPFMVLDNEARELRLILSKAADVVTCEIRGRSRGHGNFRLHARARITTRTSGSEPDLIDIAHLESHLKSDPETKTGSTEDFAAHMKRSRGIELGPRWQSPREILYGTRESMARLTLPQAYSGDARHFPLHPAVLDVAAGFAYLRRNDLFLPLSYRHAVVHASLTPEIISIAEEVHGSDESVTYRINVTDPRGRVLMEIREFTLRRVHEHSVPTRKPAPATQPARLQPQDGLAPEQATRALLSVLAMDTAQIIVSNRNPRIAPGSTRGSASTQTYERPDLKADYAPLQGETEINLGKIWGDLLRIKTIGRDDNFFELGGDSLLAIQIIPAARKADITITPGLIFEHPTIAKLAAAAQAGHSSEPDSQPAQTSPPEAELENALLEVEFE